MSKEVYKKFSSRVRASYEKFNQYNDISEWTNQVQLIASRMGLAINVSRLMLTEKEREAFLWTASSRKPGLISYLLANKKYFAERGIHYPISLK